MLWLFLVGSLLLSCPGGCRVDQSTQQISSSRQTRLQQIDAEIAQLKDMKVGFEGKALRAEDQANRLQFEDNYGIETRKYYKIAAQNREKAAKVQEEIDKLEAEKERLLK